MTTHDEQNVTVYEAACRTINSNCKLRQRGVDGCWRVEWHVQQGDQVNQYETGWFPTIQWAWKAAFGMLDRRNGERRAQKEA